MTKADRMVISVLLLAVFSSCSKDAETQPCQVEIAVNSEPMEMEEHVTICFSERHYDVSPMTRAALSSVSTRLDVWITDGTTTQDFHQTSSDADFGTITATLDKTKTYTIYAVGHKTDGQATLADGVISFQDDKVKDTFWYTTTFSPSTTTAINAEMSRIVSMFRIETTDAVPPEVKKINITQGSVFDRWNVATGATHQLDRVASIPITSTASDGTVSLSVYAINSDAQTLHTITVEAFSESDALIQSRTFENVPLRNGYRTIYRGAFFTDQSMSMSFTATDWSEYDAVAF